MRAGSAFFLLFVTFRFAFDLGGTGGSLTGFYATIAVFYVSIISIIPSAFTFTDSKGVINIGAVVLAGVGIAFFGVTLNLLLGGGDLENLYTDGWTTFQILISYGLAALAATYLVIEPVAYKNWIERGLLTLVIPLVVATMSLNPYDGEDAIDWSFRGFFTVSVVVILGLVILFFSELRRTIALPTAFAVYASITTLVSVKEYLFSDYDVFSPVIIVQCAVSWLFLLVCLWTIWATRSKNTAHS